LYMRIQYNKKTTTRKKFKKTNNKNYRIIGITVSVDFDDYLHETLPINKQFLNEMYIATSKDDKKTKSVCKKNHVKCLSIDRTDPSFLKGVYINYAFDKIKESCWFLLIDADTVITKQMYRAIHSQELNNNCLYGSGQKYCNSYEEWLEYKNDQIVKKHWRYRHLAGMGCFQLFHSDMIYGPRKLRYRPFSIGQIHGPNGRWKGSDFWFARQFRCNQRLRKTNVIHLTNGFKLGKNNHGRVTSRFQSFNS